MKVLNDHASPALIQRLVQDVSQGGATLVTDGGCPVISDPGTLLIEACIEAGIDIDAIPGPSAVTTALMLSGFFGQRFAFLGFLPRKPGPASEVLQPFVDSTLTLVLFESPFRIQKTLEVAEKTLGQRRFAICRELTKLHQQVFRGMLPETPSEGQLPRKGEITLVIEGKRSAKDADD